MLLDASDSLILFIDFQEKLFPKITGYKEILNCSLKIIEVAKVLNIPIILSEQYPKGLGNTVKSIKSKLRESNFKFFEKTTFSCLANIEIRNYLKEQEKKQIIVCGIETHICVLQTVNDLLKIGKKVFIINEAVGSRNEESKKIGINRNKKIGATLINFEMLLFELIRDSKHQKFKELSSLVK
tara:strand:- start:1098 stop:1646 length:549 start_codon:yes stop_codon:yes gene_type:complete